jgi:ABC-type transport system involved in multi-copper enzyme maturation permease subunit
MSSSIEQEQVIPALPRTSTVVMGRQGFFSVFLRSVGVELYKLRCRMMSKVLALLALLITIIVFSVLSLLPIPLQFVNVVSAVGEILNSAGMMMAIILAGTIVGGEYSVGTVRLMLTRGPTRTQFLFAKLGAVLACILMGTMGLIVLGTGLAAGFDLAKHGGPDVHFFTAAPMLSIVLYMLVIILWLFSYTAIACCLSLLGKATVAGVAGTIVWWVLESLLGNILPFIGSLNRGLLGDFLSAIPNYFLNHNLSMLAQNVLEGSNADTSVSSLQALLVIMGYLILFIGLAWWVNKRRDITN